MHNGYGKNSKGRYSEIEILDSKGSPIGEFDGIDANLGKFIEDKSARGLNTINPRTGKPYMKPDDWAKNQIHDKTVIRIENLKNAHSTRPVSGSEAPSIEDIRDYKKLEFRIEEISKDVQNAVQKQIDLLSEKYPDWEFNSVFGN